MPRRMLRTVALLQFVVLVATFLSPAYAAGVVVDPAHHGAAHDSHAHAPHGHDHDHAHDRDEGQGGPPDDGAADPHQLIGHVLGHLSPVAMAELALFVPTPRKAQRLPDLMAPQCRDLPRGLFRPPKLS